MDNENRVEIPYLKKRPKCSARTRTHTHSGPMCPRRELNPHSRCGEQDFKSCVSTSSTTKASVTDLKKIPSEERDF